MTKPFSETISFNGTVDQVLEMFRTPSFLNLVAEGTLSHSHTVQIDGSVTSVYLETEVDKIPSDLKKFFGKTIKIYNTQELPTTYIADQETTGAQKIRTSIKQAQVDATASFNETPTGCDVTYSGKAKVDFPIGPGKWENKLLKIVVSGITELERIGNVWLDQPSSST